MFGGDITTSGSGKRRVAAEEVAEILRHAESRRLSHGGRTSSTFCGRDLGDLLSLKREPNV